MSLELIPSLAATIAYKEILTSASAISHTLNGSTTIIKIVAGSYDVRVRYLTQTDIAACTATNADQRVVAGSFEYFSVPEDAISISLLSIGSDTSTIIEF